MTACVVTAIPVARAARPHGAEDALLLGRDPRLVDPDLADDPGPDPGAVGPSLPATPSSNSRIITSASSSTLRRSISASGG